MLRSLLQQLDGLGAQPDRAPQIVRYERPEPPPVTDRHPLRKLGREVREQLLAERAQLEQLLALVPEDAEPSARIWETLTDNIARMGARCDALVRRCKTAARRAHLEQR